MLGSPCAPSANSNAASVPHTYKHTLGRRALPCLKVCAHCFCPKRVVKWHATVRRSNENKCTYRPPPLSLSLFLSPSLLLTLYVDASAILPTGSASHRPFSLPAVRHSIADRFVTLSGTAAGSHRRQLGVPTKNASFRKCVTSAACSRPG